MNGTAARPGALFQFCHVNQFAPLTPDDSDDDEYMDCTEEQVSDR